MQKRLSIKGEPHYIVYPKVASEKNAIIPNSTNSWRIIPAMPAIKPAVAKPLPFSSVLLISFTAFLEKIMLIIPKIRPMKGINTDKIPNVNDIIELVFV